MLLFALAVHSERLRHELYLVVRIYLVDDGLYQLVYLAPFGIVRRANVGRTPLVY